MRFQRVTATQLRLKAYAPVLHLFARLIERVIALDFADEARVTEVFNRVAEYIRELAQETATVEDAVSDFSFTKGLVEVANTLDDALVLGLDKAATDAVTALDTLRRTLGRRVTDSVLATETLRYSGTRKLVDLVNQYQEILGLTLGKPFTESVSTADSESRVWAYGRPITEGGNYVADGYWEEGYYLPSPVASDQIRLRPSTRHSDSVSVADVFARVATQQRTLTDSFTHTEALVFVGGKAVSESATPSDSLVRHLQLYVLEGGLYGDPDYFFDSDYVSGGLTVGESLSLT